MLSKIVFSSAKASEKLKKKFWAHLKILDVLKKILDDSEAIRRFVKNSEAHQEVFEFFFKF